MYILHATAIPLLGYMHKYVHTQKLYKSVQSSMIWNRSKLEQSTCSSKIEQISELWYIYNMEYSTAIKIDYLL